MEPLILARIQFAANISFHILFPSINIAMAWFLLFFKTKYDSSKNTKWMDAYKFWVKIFALCFAIGVVSGITMSFQFGTNWPGFMKKVGDIAGPLLGYEVLTAFFLEATFLGVMLFGFNKVSNRTHTLATFLVAFGTTLSAFWIIALNSWMHTPTGYKVIAEKVIAANWLEIIFNPSMHYRLTHTLLSSGLTAAFFLAGISAYRTLKGDKSDGVMAAFKTGIYTAAILIPLQIFVGDAHGLNTLKYQPAKIAAMEGIWKTEKSAPLRLFAIPDEKKHENKYEISIPKLGSIILTHSLDGEVKGIEDFKENHPPVAPLFFSFRIMVGMGLLMLITSWFTGYRLILNKQVPNWLLKVLSMMTFSGWVAVLAGWYTTEIGRQPWIVYNILSTAEAAATNVSSSIIATSLTMYLCLYLFLITSFIIVIFYMAKKYSNEIA